MRKDDSNPYRPSFALSAGALTQLLASFACFLGAFVLPATFAEFRGGSKTVLIVLGFTTLFMGLFSLLYGRRLNRFMMRAGRKSRVVIPREGMGYLTIMMVLAVGGLLGHRNMPLLVFGMMAGPFVLNGAIVYQMLKRISVTRSVPRRAIVGELTTVELTVRNSKRWLASHMLEVRDRIEGAGLRAESSDQEGVITFVRIPASESRVGRYQVRFMKRGQYTIGPIRISSRFPLGIGERGQVFRDESEIVVHPEIGQLLPAWKRKHMELSEASARIQSRVGLFDDEFHRIREYRVGDNPRSIHWRSTARQGEIMIREYMQNRQADAAVVLDLPSKASWSSDEIELAISLAATICVEQTKSSAGQRYSLAICAGEHHFITSRSPSGFREEALDILAVCQPSIQADFESLFVEVSRNSAAHDEQIIVISPRAGYVQQVLSSIAQLPEVGTASLESRTSIVAATLTEMDSLLQLQSRDAIRRQVLHSEKEVSPILQTEGALA